MHCPGIVAIPRIPLFVKDLDCHIFPLLADLTRSLPGFGSRVCGEGIACVRARRRCAFSPERTMVPMLSSSVCSAMASPSPSDWVSDSRANNLLISLGQMI